MTLVALLIVAGCSAGEDPSTAAGITPATASAFASDGAVQDSFQAALARTVAAVGYRFDGEVTVGRADGRTVKVRLRGGVDGDGRVLVVSPADGGEVVTIRVVDGQATVDRGQGPQPLDLDQFPGVPSLQLLGDLDDLEPRGPGTVTGRLPVSAVAEALRPTRPSPSPAGSARVSVTFEPDGFVTGVHIEGPEGNFTVGTTFSDFQPGPG